MGLSRPAQGKGCVLSRLCPVSAVTDVQMEDDDGPFAGVSIALDGRGQLFALARKAVDELKLASGERVFALIKTVALDERAVALVEP
jgi:ABC-type molybdate transport system ATPase subunit